MAYLADYGLFLAKSLTIVLAVIGVIGAVVGIAIRNRHRSPEQIDVKRINDRYRDMADAIEFATLSPEQAKNKSQGRKT
jgi:serine protease SohB